MTRIQLDNGIQLLVEVDKRGFCIWRIDGGTDKRWIIDGSTIGEDNIFTISDNEEHIEKTSRENYKVI